MGSGRHFFSSQSPKCAAFSCLQLLVVTASHPRRRYLKSPPFSNITLLAMKGQLPRTASLGAAYIQRAAAGGPVARALEEVRGLGRTGTQTNKWNKCGRQFKSEVRSTSHNPRA